MLSFHSGRVGGGMTWQQYWRLWKFFPPGTNLDPLSLAIGAFGSVTLAIVLLLAYWRCYTTDMRLNRMVIVTLAAFLVGSKLVNEQYALVILPFVWLEARQVGGAWRWFYRLFWIVPLIFAIMRVPIDRFCGCCITWSSAPALMYHRDEPDGLRVAVGAMVQHYT